MRKYLTAGQTESVVNVDKRVDVTTYDYPLVAGRRQSRPADSVAHPGRAESFRHPRSEAAMEVGPSWQSDGQDT